jgi:hypothetical protein
LKKNPRYLSNAVLIYAIVAISVFSPYLFFNKTFIPSDIQKWILPWASDELENVQNHYLTDVISEVYPYKSLLKQSINNGVFPLWNPYNYFGVPQVAISTTGCFDIFNILYFVSDSVIMDACIAGLKVFLAGFFMFLLMQYYEVSFTGSFIAGLAYMFNGAFINMHTFYWMIGTFLWLPLVILFLEKSMEIKSHKKYLVYAGTILGFAHLGGHIQSSLQILIAILLWVLAKIYFNYKNNSFSSLKVIINSGAVCLLSILTAAIALFPPFELLSLGVSRSYSLLSWFHQIPQNLLKIPFVVSFFIPNFFGHHTTFSPVLLTGEKWNSYLMGYVGFIPLVLALITALYVKNSNAKQLRFIALATLFIVFLTPLVVPLYFRTLIIWCFAVSILAGFGFDFILREENKTFLKKILKIITPLFMILTLGLITVQCWISIAGTDYIPKIENYIESVAFANNPGFSFAKQFWINKVANTFRYYSILNTKLLITVGIVGCFAIAILMFQKEKLSSKYFQVGILLLTGIDLIYFFFLYVPIIDLKKYPLYPALQSTNFLKSDNTLYRVMSLAKQGVDPPIYHYESNIPHQLQMPQHCGSINYLRSTEFIKNMDIKGTGTNIINLANIKYILTKSIKLDEKKYPLVYRGEINIYQNPDMLPRVFTVNSFRVLPKRDIMYAIMKRDSFKPDSEVLLEEIPDHFPLDDLLTRSSVNVEKYEDQYVKINTETNGDSFLVMTDTNYPGWKAFIDGNETKVYTANYIFRAIYLPRGSHNVEFRFNPLSFRIGLWISMLSIVGFIGVAFFSFCTKRQVQKPFETAT